jgi:hypothetical protein
LTVMDSQDSIVWAALDKPATKAHSQWGLLKEWDLLIGQCPSSDGLIEYKKTLTLLVANILLERERLQKCLEGPIARVMGTESEFESLSNHLLNTVAAPRDGTDTRIRAESQRSFWADTFFSQSFKTGSSFLEWDAANKSGATILSVLGIPFLDDESDVQLVCDVIDKSVEQFFSVDDAGQLTAHHTMTSLLAMLKAASSQCSDGGVEIRNVVARSKLGEAVRTDMEDKVFGDAFSRRIFMEFNEFLSAGTHSHDVAESESDSESVHIDGGSRELGYRLLDDPASHSVESGSSNRGSRVPSLDGSDGEERAQELNMVSSASSGSLNSSSISTDNANLTSAPGSSDWWRNLNERIQRLCEKLKEIDSRTHFLGPLLKHESSAVPTKPVSAEVPLRRSRTGVQLKNNGENSGNKNVQSFNNRRRFSTGFFSRLFTRIRV